MKRGLIPVGVTSAGLLIKTSRIHGYRCLLITRVHKAASRELLRREICVYNYFFGEYSFRISETIFLTLAKEVLHGFPLWFFQ